MHSKELIITTKINKKALLEDFVKIILWIIFLTIALIGIYYLVKKILI